MRSRVRAQSDGAARSAAAVGDGLGEARERVAHRAVRQRIERVDRLAAPTRAARSSVSGVASWSRSSASAASRMAGSAPSAMRATPSSIRVARATDAASRARRAAGTASWARPRADRCRAPCRSRRGRRSGRSRRRAAGRRRRPSRRRCAAASSYSSGACAKIDAGLGGGGDQRPGLVGEHLEVERDGVVALLAGRRSRASGRARGARTCRPAAGWPARPGAP